MPPERVGDELQKWENSCRARRRMGRCAGAVEQEGEETLAERVACFIESENER